MSKVLSLISYWFGLIAFLLLAGILFAVDNRHRKAEKHPPEALGPPENGKKPSSTPWF